MSRLVISTVGTSLLTNEINEKKDPKSWIHDLKKSANWTQEKIETSSDYSHVSSKIIATLVTRVEKKLNDSNILEIREMSAELNGIYGLYDEKIEDAILDTHILITTDTAQGRASAQIIELFLNSKGLTNITSWIQPELSLASSNIFTESIAKLIPVMQETILDSKKNNYRIFFNLVGGFKALQGYFNTIGMFYADEIIYIFESSKELIKIPRLPVKIKIEEVEPYKVSLAMMEQGDVPVSWEQGRKVPQEWVVVDGEEKTLSTWGQLIWSQCKKQLLSQNELLKFPKIEYMQVFEEDYKIKPGNEKVILQENLARVACLLLNNNDGISAMKQDGIFRLRRYSKGTNRDIDHFDLPKDRRISCIAVGNNLRLRHYGEHNYVNDNP